MPEPITPYPYIAINIATAFLLLYFCKYPSKPLTKPLPSHWFQDQKMQSYDSEEI